jgi:hypothetical protein
MRVSYDFFFFFLAQLWVSSPSLARDAPASHEDRSDCGGGYMEPNTWKDRNTLFQREIGRNLSNRRVQRKGEKRRVNLRFLPI